MLHLLMVYTPRSLSFSLKLFSFRPPHLTSFSQLRPHFPTSIDSQQIWLFVSFLPRFLSRSFLLLISSLREPWLTPSRFFSSHHSYEPNIPQSQDLARSPEKFLVILSASNATLPPHLPSTPVLSSLPPFLSLHCFHSLVCLRARQAKYRIDPKRTEYVLGNACILLYYKIRIEIGALPLRWK